MTVTTLDVGELSERWGAARVENAMIFITKAEDRNGLAVQIPLTEGRVGAILEAVHGEYEPSEKSPLAIERIAGICHEANRAYCQALGDHSQLPWDNAPPWQRESACNGVRFHMDNPDAGPAASHQNWLKEKVDNGWVYGDVKNERVRTHSCLVPFVELPQAQQAKDYIFCAIVHAMS